MALIWTEDFESATGATSQAGVTRSAPNHDTVNGNDDGAGDYSFRTTGTPAFGTNFTGFQGSSYWAAEDINDIGSVGYTGGNTDQILWAGIDISGMTNLSFSGLFAAQRNAENGGVFRFEDSEFILIEASIDGGAFFNVLAFEDGPGGSATDFLQDTDFDGVGDGTVLTHTFTEFTANIAGTGAMLDLRITFSLDGANEEIAFDQFEINGDAGATDLTPLNDVHTGTAGDDVINALAGNDQVNGAGGNDTINGDAGNDFLVGGAGDDMLNGGDDNDMLRGDDGADELNGGAGFDTARYINSAAITINNGVATTGDAVGDTYVSIERFFFSQNDDIITGTSPGDDLYYGFGGNDVIEGGAGDDLLVGGAGLDRLNGGGGNDRVFGGADDDTLYGGTERDYLLGGAGNDRFFGGTGNDTMNGQAGMDTFVYDIGNFGNDFILGWEDGMDMIEINANLADDFSDLTVRQSGAHVVVEFNDPSLTGLIVIRNESLANITEADFDFVMTPPSILPAEDSSFESADIFAGIEAPAFMSASVSGRLFTEFGQFDAAMQHDIADSGVFL